MFKVVGDKERIRKLQAENTQLLQKNGELETAVLELAQHISDMEEENGKIVLQ